MQLLDDTGDERSTARYEWNDQDAQDERMREHRMGLGGSESLGEETEA